MPCYTPPPTREELNHYGDLVEDQLEAVLCGILTHHGDYDILSKLDWAEIGVPQSLVRKWWKKHQEEDRRRIERENKKRAEEAAKKRALSKLTKEEISLLKRKGL